MKLNLNKIAFAKIRAENKKPNKKRCNQPEHDMQVFCVRWFRRNYKGEIIFAIPNGGRRMYREAVRLKAEGVLAGVPDLFVSAARGCYHGLYLEMKSLSGRVSDVQKEVITSLMSHGYRVEVCKSIEMFKLAVDDYFQRPIFSSDLQRGCGSPIP